MYVPKQIADIERHRALHTIYGIGVRPPGKTRDGVFRFTVNVYKNNKTNKLHTSQKENATDNTVPPIGIDAVALSRF